MNNLSIWQKVEHYQQAASQQKRNDLLYQIGISLQIFTPREVMQIAKRGGKLTLGTQAAGAWLYCGLL